MRQLALAVVLGSVASAAPPKTCDANLALPSEGDKDLATSGVVKSITHVTRNVPHYTIVLTDDAKHEHAFDLYIATVPFKVKATIEVAIHRGGGWHVVYDGWIKDAAGKTLLVSSESGSLDFADGWTVRLGAVITSRQDPNQKETSVERTMGLDFERGKVKASVAPNSCAEVKDGDATYLIAGHGRSWIGLRPPEGFDYQMFSILRR